MDEDVLTAQSIEIEVALSAHFGIKVWLFQWKALDNI